MCWCSEEERKEEDEEVGVSMDCEYSKKRAPPPADCSKAAWRRASTENWAMALLTEELGGRPEFSAGSEEEGIGKTPRRLPEPEAMKGLLGGYRGSLKELSELQGDDSKGRFFLIIF